MPGPWSIYALWISLGLVCLCGALAYAELGAMMPGAGGQYTFLREAWGQPIAFLFAWCYFLVINTGTMSALGVAFTMGVESLLAVKLGKPAALGCAAGMILLLAAVNSVGVRWGALLQNVTTFAKIGSLLMIVVGALLSSAPETVTSAPAPAFALSGLVAASVAIFWAYEGWHQLPFSAAELKRPTRDLPLGLIFGLLILIALYLVVNGAYFSLVPVGEMRGMTKEIEVPAAAVGRIFGGTGMMILSAMVCLSVFGAANPNMLSSARGLSTVARDGLAPKSLTHIHTRWQTPIVAIWAQAAWAIVLIYVMKEFRDLTDFVVFVALIFYGLTVAAVYRLRRSRPDTPRPHRCLGYPLTPAVFIAAVLFVDTHRLFDADNRQNALIGLGILCAGLPVWLLIRKRA
jgi:amino acid transporter